jgi:hypothetical protein
VNECEHTIHRPLAPAANFGSSLPDTIAAAARPGGEWWARARPPRSLAPPPLVVDLVHGARPLWSSAAAARSMTLSHPNTQGNRYACVSCAHTVCNLQNLRATMVATRVLRGTCSDLRKVTNKTVTAAERVIAASVSKLGSRRAVGPRKTHALIG